MDASKRDTRANAFFAGLGVSKRVVLFDTLLNKLKDDEILAVLAHELGHFKNRDIIKNILVIGIVLFIFFYIFGNLPVEVFDALKVPRIGVNVVILALLYSEVIFFVLSPFINFISRKNEFEADKFAISLTSPSSLSSALKVLIKENKHFPKVSNLYSFIHYTHPPILERLKRIENASINNGN
jgi:STE24 endopeptidase